jgi:hypothetical protein
VSSTVNAALGSLDFSVSGGRRQSLHRIRDDSIGCIRDRCSVLEGDTVTKLFSGTAGHSGNGA